MLLLKGIYGTLQAAWRWSISISDRMAKNGYNADNNEKTTFIETKGSDPFFHDLFIDDMGHIIARDKLKNEFMTKY